MQGYIKRSLASRLIAAANQFPAVVLTGPRQAGKTTLLKSLFAQQYRYANLDLPDMRAAAVHDPRGFLQHYSAPVIFDEIQNVPELFPYIKDLIDAQRGKPGQYLLSGSQRVTESLAGRAAILKLFPLSFRETLYEPERLLVWQREEDTSQLALEGDLWQQWLRGSYPEIVVDPKRDKQLWYASYIQTYLERDLRSMHQVGDLTQFQSFLHALAARNAQLLNLSELARDIGVAVNTVKRWLSLLEASYQIIILRPYHANISKRLVKMPKVYFTDMGVLSYLVGLSDSRHAISGPMAGSIFETAILLEIIKTLTNQGDKPEIYFWRTAMGSEVDFLIKYQQEFIALEAKHSATPRPAMAKGISALRKDLPGAVACGYVIHTGSVCLPLGDGVLALPFLAL